MKWEIKYQSHEITEMTYGNDKFVLFCVGFNNISQIVTHIPLYPEIRDKDWYVSLLFGKTFSDVKEEIEKLFK
jgi:hypothetical protein